MHRYLRPLPASLLIAIALLIAGCANLTGSAGSGLDYGEPFSDQKDGTRDLESYGFDGIELSGAAGALAEVHDDAQAVLELVNEARCTEGLPPVALNLTLNEAAAAHSLDMLTRDYADHTTPEGAEPGDRLTAAGYDWSAVGENLAFGADDAQAVVDGWMESEGHRANLLNPEYREIGLGHVSADGTEWTHYWTLVLAAPANGDSTPAGDCDGS